MPMEVLMSDASPCGFGFPGRRLLLGLALLGSSPAWAQVASPALAAPAPAQRLSLIQAIQTALDQNPRVHQSLLAIAESGEDRKSAAASLMPHVGAQAFSQRNKYSLDALMGMPQPHGPQLVGPFSWNQVAARL